MPAHAGGAAAAAVQRERQSLQPRHQPVAGRALGAFGRAPGAGAEEAQRRLVRQLPQFDAAHHRREPRVARRVLGKDHPLTRTFAANLASLLGEQSGSGAAGEPPRPEPPAWSLGPTLIGVSYAASPAGLGYSISFAGSPNGAGPPPAIAPQPPVGGDKS